jgi:hypothetical protein
MAPVVRRLSQVCSKQLYVLAIGHPDVTLGLAASTTISLTGTTMAEKHRSNDSAASGILTRRS